MSLTKVTQSMIEAPYGNVKDYGAVGDDSTDDSAAIQAAVNDICDNQGTLYFPPGTYRLQTTITFPNKSFVIKGSGATASSIAADTSTPNITLFDFTGCNGPHKLIENISFNGPDIGVFGGTAVAAYGNGFLFDNVWFRGIAVGLRARGSLINTRNCVSEFCSIGAWADDNSGARTSAIEESIWSSWTMYNNNTDFIIQGDNKTFTLRDTNCIGTIDDCVRIEGSGNFVDGVTAQKNDPTSTRTPYVIRLISCQKNIINNVYTIDCGKYGVFFEGTLTQENMLTNLHIQGTEVGLYYSASSNNFVSNAIITDSTDYAVQFIIAQNNRIENFYMADNNDGVYFGAAALNSLINGKIERSAANDFVSLNTTSAIIHNVDADYSGVSGIAYRYSILASGQKQVLATAAPTTSGWNVGDICINSAPAVGSPKGWRCTVAGSPGTWVSEGNL